MKKVLMLGGAITQVPAIIKAKQLGYYVITCDYLPDNPGHKYSDEYYNISTTDEKGVLKLAQKLQIDGIVCYASDPAASTAAYVAENMGLPTNPYNSVKILSNKDLFRKFLKENNYNCPKAISTENYEDAKEQIKEFSMPIIVKPTDSSGSKGIKRIDNLENLEEAFNYAKSKSRNGLVIVEEFIEKANEYIIGGDIFVLNGKVAFWGLMNCHRDDKVNALIPIGKSFPANISKEQFTKIEETLNSLMDKLAIKAGAFNIEMIFDKKQNLYLIEVGPRNGGNMIPNLLQEITNVDLIEATVEVAMGNYNIDLESKNQGTFCSLYIIHSGKEGILEEIQFVNGIEENIIQKFIQKEQGEKVDIFRGSNDLLGIVFFKFDTREEMLEKMNNMDKYVQIKLKG